MEHAYIWDRVLTDEDVQLLADAEWPSPPYTMSAPVPCPIAQLLSEGVEVDFGCR